MDLALARAFHLLAIVLWFGGVATVTLVLIPAIRSGAFGARGGNVFEAFESRFVWYARAATIVVALTGFYMVDRLAAWDRFRSVHFWWMHAMVFLWLLFTLLLFVIEPLVHRKRRHSAGVAATSGSFVRMQQAHWFLLILGIVTIAGAVIGSQGVSVP